MRGNAFGNPCLTLEEVIEGLLDVARLQPHLLGEPVWAINPHGLHRPINNVTVIATGETPRIHAELAR